jgi:hypothetical protein
MRLILILIFTLTDAEILYGANDPFPVPMTGNDIQDAYLNTEKWDGKLIGLAGIIQEIKDGNQGKPLIRVSLRKPNDNNISIWVGSLVKPEPGQIQVGQIIRVLGYLYLIDSTDPLTAATVKDPLFLMAFCLVNQSNKIAFFLPAGVNQCNEWKTGTIPKDHRK